MSKKSVPKNTKVITYQMPQLSIAQYLVVVADRGITSEVNYFDSLKEAKRAFGEIAHDHGFKSDEKNESDYFDVSIWQWTEDRYEKVQLYM